MNRPTFNLDAIYAARESADDRVTPFSNGSQFMDWEANNCLRCTKRWDEGIHTFYCDLDAELTIAAVDDGTLRAETARRLGFDSGSSAYSWMCPEVEWTEEWKAEHRARQEAAS